GVVMPDSGAQDLEHAVCVDGDRAIEVGDVLQKRAAEVALNRRVPIAGAVRDELQLRLCRGVVGAEVVVEGIQKQKLATGALEREQEVLEDAVVGIGLAALDVEVLEIAVDELPRPARIPCLRDSHLEIVRRALNDGREARTLWRG